MAMAGRLRSGLPFLRRVLVSDTISAVTAQRSAAPKPLLRPLINTELSRDFGTAFASTEQKFKVPLTMFGVSGNYASALYIAAVKANVLNKVESELLGLIESSKKSPTFSQFMKDLSITADVRVKAVDEISTQAKFSDITKNFLAVVAESGRLSHLERIAQRFTELTMAHKGEVKVIVTSVIPLPQEEEKELEETLQVMIGQGKKVKVEEKIDPSILGGLVVEFGQKVFDMSIKTRARQMERFLQEPVNLDS
ncbi:ATP synthase subunit O, mitochondrial-like isoform X1 [Olea europaea var. sylvestris]|uniref:ATP synthase subunit O, mitochondrial-like isoform X1 n=1 Tax=Olea europaea var. sylvestris TaxID=158386 RepID=UPI000C1D8C32|nr:ATP synthase subunit O, mitochondrial-like isoform X1 [Olea europaea var. sylvestris]